MEPTGIVIDHDKETQEVKWVDIEKAYEMIEQTKTVKGRNRDKLAVISAIKTRDLLKVISRSPIVT